MKKFICNINTLPLMIILITFSNTIVASQQLYPFKQNPELSWSDFEKNFRQTYKHLDIPRIEIRELNKFADSATYNFLRINKVAGIEQKAPFISINSASQRIFKSPEQLEGVLLHEIGHHYGQEELEKAYDFTEDVVFSIFAGNIMLSAYHLKLLNQNRWSNKIYFAQKIGLGLLFSAISFIDYVFAVRPAEYAADAFAHKHATKEALIAYRNSFKKETIAEVFLHYISLLMTEGITSEDLRKKVVFAIQNPDASIDNEAISKDEKREILVLMKICNFVGNLAYHASALDLSHPSSAIRYKLANQALKDRFGVNESNK